MTPPSIRRRVISFWMLFTALIEGQQLAFGAEAYSQEEFERAAYALVHQDSQAAAETLGRIGSNEALEILVRYLENGEPNVAGRVLKSLGRRSIPYLTAALADRQKRDSADYWLWLMASDRTVTQADVEQWKTQALDDRADAPRRIGAIRAMKYGLMIDWSKSLEVLRIASDDSEADIHREAREILLAAESPLELDNYMHLCLPRVTNGYMDEGVDLSCLWKANWEAIGAILHAETVATFLNSPNPSDQMAAATILGFLGDTKQSGRIAGLLKSNDWMVVYVASRSLGWLGEKNSIEALSETGDTHWFAPVRAIAHISRESIASGTSKQLRPRNFDWRELGLLGWNLNEKLPGIEQKCSVENQVWHGKKIEWQQREKNRVRNVVLLADGALVAENFGEWGGRLKWVPALGTPETLHADNAFSVFVDDDIVLAVFGSGHMGLNRGYIMKWSRSKGGFLPEKLGRLPSYPQAVAVVDEDTFSVFSGGVIVLFDGRGILGTGECPS